MLFSYKAENNTIRKTVEQAVKESANLSNANMSDTNLSDADLSDADLRYANLTSADLTGANLSGAKDDLFVVISKAKAEIPALKQAMREGKINGSCYEGDCCCLSGTLLNAAENQQDKDNILSVRDAYRPIERFFLAIQPKDTPENNPIAKIVYEWIEEFEKTYAK